MSDSTATDVRFPLVRQGMIDAVQAAGHHAMAQQALQRILQALEWQERNGCTCCRVVRAVDRHAHELAYAHAGSAVECASVMGEDEWMKLGNLEEYEKEVIERDFLYLEMRGLIERHPKKMDWFRVRDEAEAAIVVEVGRVESRWRVVNKFVKDEFCPVFDTEQEARRNFNRHTPNDIRIERLDTTITIVKDVSDRRCARIDCRGAHCGEWNCDSCHPEEVCR